MADPIINPTPQGTYVNGQFFANLGNSDSAFPSAPPSSIVTTAGPATTSFNNHSSNLQTMLTSLNQNSGSLPGSDINVDNVNDSYTQMLDRLGRSSDASTKALIGTINASRSNRGNEINTQYDNYKRGLQLLGIQHNDAQATPDLLMGHVKQAENEHQAKLQALDVETNKALMDAENAKEKNDLTTLESKMAYVDKLKQEKRDYLKNIAEQMTAGNTIAANIIAGDYDQFKNLSAADQEKYIKHVASSFGISEQSVRANIVKQEQSAEDRALDIAGKKKALAKSSSAGGNYTATELRKLRQAGIDPSKTDMADNFLYGDNKGVLPPKFTRDKVSDFGKSKVWKLALALGIPRNKNLSKKGEIDALFANSELTSYVQDMLNEGHSIDDIIASQ